MKASKIASIAYYVLLALSAVVFVLFFCVGFGNMESLPSGFYKSPQFTDVLMYWMYALVAICAVCTIIGAVTAKGGKVDSNMPTWGKFLAQAGLWLFIPVLVVTFFMGDDTVVRLGTGELYDSKFWLVATDAIIYTIYVLVVVTILALVASLSGIFKK
jgi:hypothetical protein